MPVWNSSYLGEWRVMSVDPKTWADKELIGYTSNYAVKSSIMDDVPLIQTGSFSIDLRNDAKFEPGWYRVEMRGDDGYDVNNRVYLATLLCERVSGNKDYGTHVAMVRGRSVLAPTADAKMLAGDFINRGADGAQWVAEKLSMTTPAPVNVEGSFTVDNYYVWDANTSYLKAIWDILDAAGWCILISGTGTITVCAKPIIPSIEYDDAHSNVFLPGMSYDNDITAIPNRYYAIEGTNRAVAINDDPDSLTSFTRRGWWKDHVDTNVIRINGESLQAYAERMLEEQSTVTETWTYQREFVDDVGPFQIVRANRADVVQGDLRILTQDFSTDHGILVDEEAGLEVKLWQRLTSF